MSFGKTIQLGRASFVGRAHEMDLLRRHVKGDWPWRWLHICGQSGIGKSTLLRRFRTESEGYHFYYVDGSKGIQQKEDVLVQLAAQLRDAGESNFTEDSEGIARCMNRRLRSLGNHAVLFIDEFDQWHSISYWFLHWLNLLDASVQIVTAGRNLLTGSWLRSEWADRIRTTQVQALTFTEVESYAQECGINDIDSHTELYRFSRGVPLAMVLAAETTLMGNGLRQLELNEQFHLISVLMSEMLIGQPPFMHRMLEAASVYWRFNEERLEAIMDTGLEADAFRQFVGMPFVNMKEDGWMLHDAVRAWTLEDFMLRKPNTYEQMRSKALRHIRMEESLNPLRGQRPQLDKLNLHEHPLVRTLCFYGHMDDMEVRQCRECDLPAIRELYIKSHSFTSTSRADLPPLVNRINKLWELVPSAFITIWRDNNIVAFFGKIPLHDKQVIQEINKDPLLQPFINGWKSIPHAYLIALVGIDPQLEWRYRSYVTHTLLNHYCSPEWILALTSWKEWFPVFELCGFERAAWADSTTELGTEYQAFVLDLRKEDFITKLDRSVSQRSTTVASTLIKAEPYIQELKDILKHWAVLPSKPSLIQTYSRMFPHRLAPDTPGGKASYEAKKDIFEAISSLTEGNEQEEMLGKLLTITYIDGVRPLERAAKSLNLSMATYYRHLNKALELLYQVLARGGS